MTDFQKEISFGALLLVFFYGSFDCVGTALTALVAIVR